MRLCKIQLGHRRKSCSTKLRHIQLLKFFVENLGLQKVSEKCTPTEFQVLRNDSVVQRTLKQILRNFYNRLTKLRPKQEKLAHSTGYLAYYDGERKRMQLIKEYALRAHAQDHARERRLPKRVVSVKR